jgi:transketolase
MAVMRTTGPLALARAIRLDAIDMISRAKSSHIGSVFSVADIVAVLYGAVLRHRPEDPAWAERDRMILSKGHAGAAIYAALAECGYFSREKLDSYYSDGSVFSGHISHCGVPGVELSTGALGHGLSVGAGIALHARRRGLDFRTFVLMSDGECDEGSVWEAAMFAAHHRLGNLVGIVDYNELQSLATTHETLELEPFVDKWRSFGWDVMEVDGHDVEALEQAIDSRSDGERPRCVIAHTVKGRGVSFMERTVLWHYRTPAGEELQAALRELGAAL